ncbi:MAG: PKD domain-containing protein, partial [Myxococcaceae bacterium]
SGTVSFTPALADASGTTIEASDGQSAPVSVNADGSGAFRFVTIAPGLYTLSFHHDLYTPVAVPNLLVTSGGQLVLANVVMTQNPALPVVDAGVQPVPDAGSSNGDGGVNANLPPIANAGLPQVARTKDPVQLNGSASVDPEAEPLRYKWEELSDAGVNVAPNDSLVASHPTFIAPPTAALLSFRLTVTDPEGASSTSTTTVDVVPAPRAVIDQPPPLSLRPGESLQLSGSGSTNPSHLPLTYAWDHDPNGLALTVTTLTDGGATVTAPSASGVGTVRLSVRDEFVQSFPTTLDITVGASSSQLAVNASASAPNRSSGNATFGDLVTLKATATSSNPNDVVSFSWTQLNTPVVTLTGANAAQAQFTAPSTPAVLSFRVTATVSGVSQTADVSVTVSDLIAPTVTVLDPVTNGFGSPLFAKLQFSKDMEPSTVEDSNNVYLTGSGSTVWPSAVTYDSATRTAQLTWLKPLTGGSSYTIHVDSVTDNTPNHNGLTGFASTFTARAFQTTLFQETTVGPSSVSTQPYIAWTPIGVFAVGTRQDTGWCSGTGSLYPLTVNETAGTLSVTLPLSGGNCVTSDPSFGDFGPKVAWANGLWFETRNPNVTGQYEVHRLVGSTLQSVPPGFNAAQLGPNGSTLWEVYAYANGLRVCAFDGTSAWSPFIQIDSTCDPSSPATFTAAGDGVNLFGACLNQANPPQMQVSKLVGSSGAYVGVASQGGTTTGRPRIRIHKGAPVLTQAEYLNGRWQLFAYRWNGTAFSLLGGGPVNTANSDPSFDAAVLGDELYVLWLDSGKIFLRRTDLLTAGSWVDVLGPNTGGAMNVNTACLADRPSIDSGPDALWITWTEGCGTTPSWQTLVRKVY